MDKLLTLEVRIQGRAVLLGFSMKLSVAAARSSDL